MPANWSRVVAMLRPYVLVVALGACVGLLVRQAMSRLLTQARETSASIDAEQEARELLGCYSLRARELAQAAAAFERAEFEDVAGLRQAMRTTLLQPLQQSNEAFTRLTRARLVTAMGLLRDGRTSPYCKLQAVERFQWETLRPAINRCLGNLIVAWHQAIEPDQLQEIKRQQRDPVCWEALRETAQRGADQFSEGRSSCRMSAPASGAPD